MPGCTGPGEFRAPGTQGSSFDGPGDWRWFCLDHVREFNAGYDWFEGMSAEEILAALAERLGNDPVTERRVVAEQLREIAVLRLEGELT